MTSLRSATLLAFVSFTFLSSSIAGAQEHAEIDMSRLRLEVGDAQANGTGVIISQVEASSGDDYMADPTNAQFLGKTFWDGTGAYAGVSTSHSNNVAGRFFGDPNGMSRGATDITAFDADDWLNNIVYNNNADPRPVFNNDPSNSNPNPQTIEVMNHSWVVRSTNISNNDATIYLRRIDFIANRDNTTFCVGADNGGSTEPLLAPGYNSITVGRTNGGGASGATTFYGAGRQKPEIVSPSGTTSRATAIISGVAGVIRQNSPTANSQQNEVTKAVLLAGATKEEFPTWDRTTTRPIDEVFGTGEVNAYNSYLIITGGEYDGSNSVPGVPIGAMGWDYSPSITTEKYYTIDAPFGIDKASFVLTWNVSVVDNNASPNIFSPSTTLANMDLELYDLAGSIVDMSVSPEHNIEHIYALDLPADSYTLRVISNTDHDYALAWRIHAAQYLPVDSIIVSAGNLASGSSDDLAESDNLDVSARRSPVDVQSRVHFELKGVSPLITPDSLSFTVEASVFARTNVVQKIDLWDYDLSDWVEVDSRNATRFTDSTATVDATGDLARFIEPLTKCLQARVRYISDNPRQQFTANVDQMVWLIE